MGFDPIPRTVSDETGKRVTGDRASSEKRENGFPQLGRDERGGDLGPEAPIGLGETSQAIRPRWARARAAFPPGSRYLSDRSET